MIEHNCIVDDEPMRFIDWIEEENPITLRKNFYAIVMDDDDVKKKVALCDIYFSAKYILENYFMFRGLEI